MQVPTGKDLGKMVMVRDRDDSAWKGPFELQGVRVPVTRYPYIADDNGWAYAKLVDEEQGEDRTAPDVRGEGERTMNINDLKVVLEKHAAWLAGDREYGERANLVGADLRGTDLRHANLERANLVDADLRGADLRGVNLKGANLGVADLRGTYLRGSNLWGANLSGCIGNMTQIKSLYCEKCTVTYTADVMQIGFQRHSIADWWEFDDNKILEMGGEAALKWWRTWKPILQQIIEASPAQATGGESAAKEAG